MSTLSGQGLLVFLVQKFMEACLGFSIRRVHLGLGQYYVGTKEMVSSNSSELHLSTTSI